MHLDRRYVSHHRIEKASVHRQSHGHVDVMNLFRNRIQDRLEQAFIRKHDSAFLRSSRPLTQNVREPLGLSGRRSDAYHIDLRAFYPFRIPSGGLWELQNIVCHEERRAVLRILDHVT